MSRQQQPNRQPLGGRPSSSRNISNSNSSRRELSERYREIDPDEPVYQQPRRALGDITNTVSSRSNSLSSASRSNSLSSVSRSALSTSNSSLGPFFMQEARDRRSVPRQPPPPASFQIHEDSDPEDEPVPVAQPMQRVQRPRSPVRRQQPAPRPQAFSPVRAASPARRPASPRSARKSSGKKAQRKAEQQQRGDGHFRRLPRHEPPSPEADGVRLVSDDSSDRAPSPLRPSRMPNLRRESRSPIRRRSNSRQRQYKKGPLALSPRHRQAAAVPRRRSRSQSRSPSRSRRSSVTTRLRKMHVADSPSYMELSSSASHSEVPPPHFELESEEEYLGTMSLRNADILAHALMAHFVLYHRLKKHSVQRPPLYIAVAKHNGDFEHVALTVNNGRPHSTNGLPPFESMQELLNYHRGDGHRGRRAPRRRPVLAGRRSRSRRHSSRRSRSNNKHPRKGRRVESVDTP